MYKVIVTGATGMVGEGVMYECLQSKLISEVLIINRRPSTFSHPKLKQIIHADFFNLKSVEEQLKGYDACFFCLGVTSLGKSEEEYSRQTHDLTLHVGETLSRMNPSMVFCYISGAGNDLTESRKMMWARVKGRTVNDLSKLPFKAVYDFRPAMIEPVKGLKNTLKFYNYIGWSFPILYRWFPDMVCRLGDIGKAMINVLDKGYDGRVLEVSDIKRMAAQKS
ncbi:MAG: hypothetical protein RL213_409 [Bacteroidota bacterium]|jgi:uncharacterized protein YbjT (DUF2867 family)